MFRIKLLLIIGGGFLAFVGFQEFRVSYGTSNEPASVALSTLETGGELPNNHIEIGQHVAIYAAAVYEYREKKGAHRGPGVAPSNSAKVTHVYYPVISEDHQFFKDLNALAEKYGNPDAAPDSEFPEINDFRVLIKSEKYKTIGSIPDGLAPKSNIRGLVVNEIEGISKDEQRLLHQSFPKTDLDNLLVLEEDRQPASLFKSLGFLFGGAILSLGGVLSFFAGGRE